MAITLLQQWGSAPALLGGDPLTEGLSTGAERRGLVLVLLGGSSVAAGLGAGVEGRGSDGMGLSASDNVAPVASVLREVTTASREAVV
jgi:hypothetical protein